MSQPVKPLPRGVERPVDPSIANGTVGIRMDVHGTTVHVSSKATDFNDSEIEYVGEPGWLLRLFGETLEKRIERATRRLKASALRERRRRMRVQNKVNRMNSPHLVTSERLDPDLSEPVHLTDHSWVWWLVAAVFALWCVYVFFVSLVLPQMRGPQ